MGVTRLSLKGVFCDTIEHICQRIKGYTNTKGNLNDWAWKYCDVNLPCQIKYNYIYSYIYIIYLYTFMYVCGFIIGNTIL